MIIDRERDKVKEKAGAYEMARLEPCDSSSKEKKEGLGIVLIFPILGGHGCDLNYLIQQSKAAIGMLI